MYLPALRWSSLKVNPDPMPELGKRLKEALSKVAAGDLDEKLFEPSFLAALKPVLAQQKAGLAQLGPIEQLDFLDAKAWGKGRLVHYRAKFKSVTLYATAMFDPQGRIEYMAFEAAED